MLCKKIVAITTAILLNSTSMLLAQGNMEVIDGGNYIPMFGDVKNGVDVDPFMLDIQPVTNQEFLDFVKEYPRWQRSRVIKLFANDNYLSHWKNDTDLGDNVNPDAPVINVSWFAAKAFAKWKGKRLPTTDEWEFTAMASKTKIDARKDSLFNVTILSWYETPKTFNNSVGQGEANLWNIKDLYGLIWEWTSDFNSILITGESRGDFDSNSTLFCGGGSATANDLMNYAAFMRYAFRGSLKANYAIQNLGFRCAKDIDPNS